MNTRSVSHRARSPRPTGRGHERPVVPGRADPNAPVHERLAGVASRTLASWLLLNRDCCPPWATRCGLAAQFMSAVTDDEVRGELRRRHGLDPAPEARS